MKSLNSKNEHPHVDWEYLKAIPLWTPLSTLSLKYARALNDDLTCVGEHVYLFCVSERLIPTKAKGPFVTIVLWAQSDGAAKRAMLAQIEADDEQGSAKPPSEMLVAADCTNYGNLIRQLKSQKSLHSYTETARYRIASDGRLICSKVQTGQFEFLFRRLKVRPSDSPFAIAFRLITKERTSSGPKIIRP